MPSLHGQVEVTFPDWDYQFRCYACNEVVVVTVGYQCLPALPDGWVHLMLQLEPSPRAVQWWPPIYAHREHLADTYRRLAVAAEVE